MKTHILAIAAALLLCLGCAKESLKTIDPMIPAREQKATVSNVRSPLNNPFEYLGELHNQSVQAVWDYVQKTGDTTGKGKRAFFIRYYSKTFGTDPTKMIMACELMKKQSIERLLEKSTLSAESKALLKAIKDTGAKLDDEASYTVFKDRIRQIESEAKENIKDETERNVVLQVAVIARYSAAFWKQKLIDFGTSAPGKWWVFASADIIGGIMGGIFGGGVLEMASEMSSGMNWYADHYWG